MGWGGCGHRDLRCSSQLETERNDKRLWFLIMQPVSLISETWGQMLSMGGALTLYAFHSPLNDSIRGQRLLPAQLDGAGGQGDGARRKLKGWGGSQGVQLTQRALTTALLKHRLQITILAVRVQHFIRIYKELRLQYHRLI